MKILPKLYASAQGEAFRVEDYRGSKLEFYYLDDQKDYGKYVSRGRFYVWTSDGTSYRLFVEKGYYNAVPDLFQNEVNDIWLDFTNSIYGAQKKMTNLYMWISLGIMALTLIGMYLAMTFFPEVGQTIFLVVMVILFIGLFVGSNFQQKKLRALLEKENQEASAKIRGVLGEARFQGILDNQEKYYQEFFKFDEEPVAEDGAEVTQDALVDSTDANETIDQEDKHE